MTDAIREKLSRLSSRIDKIQSQIDYVNKVTDEAISKLETQKRDIRGFINPNFPIIQKNIQEITVEHDRILEKLLQKQSHVKHRKASLDELDFTVAELDREISRVQAERDRTILALLQKREEIIKALKTTEELNLQIRQLNDEIALLTADYEADMKKLIDEKNALLARDDLTESQKELALAELERKIAEKELVHQQHMDSLQMQKQESEILVKEFDEEMATEMKDTIKTQIDDLEAMKVGASPSEIETINRRINQLKEKIDDVELLGALKARGLKITPSGRILTDSGELLTIEEAIERGLLKGLNIMKLLLRIKLKKEGLGVTPSGRIKTASGKLLTLDEARETGIIDPNVVDAIHSALSKKGSSTATSEVFTDMTTEDVHYLKTTVGKPLTLALAEICTKQPRDPIHYLGHWLFKYRYNQEIDECKKREIEELMELREKMRQETLQQEVEDAARAAVLEMVFKAHDEAVQHELNARTTSMLEGDENDELREEAKDVLGEYNGPPAGQRRI